MTFRHRVKSSPGIRKMHSSVCHGSVNRDSSHRALSKAVTRRTMVRPESVPLLSMTLLRRASLTVTAGICPSLVTGCIPNESELQTFAIDFLRQALAAWLL